MQGSSGKAYTIYYIIYYIYFRVTYHHAIAVVIACSWEKKENKKH